MNRPFVFSRHPKPSSVTKEISGTDETCESGAVHRGTLLVGSRPVVTGLKMGPENVSGGPELTKTAFTLLTKGPKHRLLEVGRPQITSDGHWGREGEGGRGRDKGGVEGRPVGRGEGSGSVGRDR